MRVLGGRYRLDGQLGAGGMSQVWRGHDEVLGRAVAVKVLAMPDDAGARTRIRTEARAAAGIWHPNVTNVYDYGEAVDADGRTVPYVVMELLPGRTLQDRLTAGPLAPRAALRVGAEVAAALAAAHEAGLVHRDVKPSNVMLTPSGAKVFDFGIAAIAGRSQLDEDGQLYGTPAYLAPERLVDGVVLPASDVYSLGLLIYHGLTGRLPWLARTVTDLIDAHANIEPEALPYISGVGPEVENVYARCLAKDPADRPTAAEIAAILATAAGIVALPDDEPDPDPVPDPSAGGDTQAIGAGRPRRRRARLALVGLAVLALIALALTVWWPGDQPTLGSTPPAGAASGPVGLGPGADATSGATATPGAGATPGATAASGATAIPGATSGASAGQTPAPTAPGGGGPVATPTLTGAPTAPAVTPTPTPTVTSTPPPGLPVTATGGTVVVTCVGQSALIVLATPNLGYRVTKYEPGPADQVKTEFTGTGHRSEIDARCHNGVATPTVKESSIH